MDEFVKVQLLITRSRALQKNSVRSQRLGYPGEYDGVKSCELVGTHGQHGMKNDRCKRYPRTNNSPAGSKRLADEIADRDTGYAIERALDIARAQAFKPFMPRR